MVLTPLICWASDKSSPPLVELMSTSHFGGGSAATAVAGGPGLTDAAGVAIGSHIAKV